MPKSPKNLQPDAPGAPASTQERAKVAQSIFNLSDEEIIHRFKSLSESEIRDLAPVLRILFCMLLIHNNKR
jgi:hypothetical protein